MFSREYTARGRVPALALAFGSGSSGEAFSAVTLGQYLWRPAVTLAPSRCRPPTRPEAAFGVVVAEQGKIYPAMSGHNVICVATALLETGMVPIERGSATTTFHLDLPAPSS